MITCSNCGAGFAETLAQCPYCGHIYIPAAEKEYMENLQEIREDMEEIEGITEKIYHKEIRGNVKRVYLWIISAVLVLLIAIGLFAGLKSLFSYEESEAQLKERILWQKENFPMLDAWYQEKEYEKIVDFMEEAYEKEGYFCDEWEHYEYILQYENYRSCQILQRKIEENAGISEFEAGELMYCTMALVQYEKGYKTQSYSGEDLENLEQWKEQVRNWFLENLDYTEAEFCAMEEKVYRDGYLSYELCGTYKKEILEKIK